MTRAIARCAAGIVLLLAAVSAPTAWGQAAGESGEDTARQALEEARIGLEVAIEAEGPDHPEVAARRSDLASELFRQGDRAGAEEQLRRAVEILRAAPSEEADLTARSLHNLAYVLAAQDKHEEAVGLYRQAIEEYRLHGLEMSQNRAGSNKTLGDSLVALQRNEEAEESYRTALGILERLADVNGDYVDGIRYGLIDLYKGREAFDEAETAYRDMIAAQAQRLGEDHHVVVGSMTDLARLLESLERYDEAEALHRDGMARYRSSLGEDHYTIGWKHLHLGRLYRKQDRQEDAAREFAAAEPYQEPFLAAEAAQLGADSPGFAQRLMDTAWVYRNEIGDLDKARSYAERALALLEAAYGPDDPRLLEPLGALGDAIEAQGAYAEGIAVHRRIVALTERREGRESPALIEPLKKLAFALNDGNQPREADRQIERALEITLATAGPESRAVGERYNELGVLAMRRGDDSLAADRYRQSHEVFVRLDGPTGRKAVNQQANVLRSLRASGRIDEAVEEAVALLDLTAGTLDLKLDLFRELLLDGYLSDPSPAQSEALFEAIAAREHEEIGRGRTLLLHYLGHLARNEDKPDLAESMFRQSLAVYRETVGPEPDREPEWMAPQLFELASLSRQKGALAQAVRHVDEAIALLVPDESLDLPTLVKSESLRGVLALDLGEVEQGREVLTRAMARLPRLDPPQPRLAAQVRHNLANAQQLGGDPALALDTLAPALASIESAFGEDDVDFTLHLKYRGVLKSSLDDPGGAEADFRRALEIEERNGRGEQPFTADLVADLASTLSTQARHAETLPLLERAVEIRQARLGPDHLKVAEALVSLGDSQQTLGRNELAHGHFQRALEIRERNPETTPELMAWALERVADTAGFLGDIDGAGDLLRRALAVWRESDPTNEWRAQTLRKYAAYLRITSDYDGGVAMNREALTHSESLFGKTSPKLFTDLNTLAHAYLEMGRSFDAAEQQLRAIAILESQDQGDPLQLAMSLTKLASIKMAWREDQEAEQLLLRAEAALAPLAGRTRFAVGSALQELGAAFKNLEQLDKAERLLRQAMQVFEATTGEGHLQRSMVRLQLANVELDREEFASALALMEQTFDEIKDRLGPDNPITGLILEVTPAIYFLNGQPEKALALFDEALAAGAGDNPMRDNPMMAFVNAYRGLVEWQRGDLDAALATISQASAMERQNIRRAAQDRSGSGQSRPYNFAIALTAHIALLHHLATQEPEKRARYLAEAFEIAQEQQGGSAAGALARMAARFGAGSDRLAGVVRERQDRLEHWTRISRSLSGAASKPLDRRDLAEEAEQRALLARLDGEMAALDQTIARDFPDYAALIRPGAATLEEIQRLLGPDEALLFFSVQEAAENPALEIYLKDFIPGRTTLWLVRPDSLELVWIDLDKGRLKESVTELRRTLDPSVLFIERLEDVPPFEESTAHRLYRDLFAPAEPLLEGVRNLFVVPSGPLQSLPLGVLITEPSDRPVADLAGHAKLNWLARDYAMTTLPSVSSLRSLRHFAGTARAGAPFTGFGNPLLQGDPGEVRGLNLAAMFRGALADVSAVRDLPALPDSEKELRDMAAALAAPADSLYLAEQATEAQVKTMDLSDSRVLAFATHGLVAGELADNVEPALVLTPPETGSALDDGLLTASEIAQLKLNADWVILSACNTASGDRPGAEGLSGLARAFFYAGSRALLVSHWPVVSDAAVKLTTRMLEAARRDDLTRAEALQLSLLSLMEDPEHPYYAHPMFWAPFTVVGEGGRLGG